MKLIVISPESADPRELPVLAELFAAGLTDYHLRKPTWSREPFGAFLRGIPSNWHDRIILHSHHDLSADFAVAGIHYPESLANQSNPLGYFLRSRAVHDCATLRASLDTDQRLLFSPVFPSISKPGHVPHFTHDEVHAVLTLPRRAEVIALGGIDATRIPECRALGFDGVAVLGSIWQAPDPVGAYVHLHEINSFA